MFELIKRKNRLNPVDTLLDTIFDDRYSISNHIDSDSYFSNDENNYYIEIALPGLLKKDVNLIKEDDYLVLSHESSSDLQKHVWHRSFNKRILIPNDVKENGVSAKLKDGILSIKLAKDKNAIKSTVIDIK